jgi:hypothetical protein
LKFNLKATTQEKQTSDQSKQNEQIAADRASSARKRIESKSLLECRLGDNSVGQLPELREQPLDCAFSNVI